MYMFCNIFVDQSDLTISKTKRMSDSLTLYFINTHFDSSTTDSFRLIVGKEEIARNEQFLLFQQCFLLNLIIICTLICPYF